MIFIEFLTLAKVSIYQSILARFFGTWSLGFLWSSLWHFFCLIFLNETQTVARFTEYLIYCSIIETGLFFCPGYDFELQPVVRLDPDQEIWSCGECGAIPLIYHWSQYQGLKLLEQVMKVVERIIVDWLVREQVHIYRWYAIWVSALLWCHWCYIIL